MAKKTKSSKAKPAAKDLRQQDLVEYLRKHAKEWLDRPNITSVGVGHKVKGTNQTDRLCIQVTVGHKLKSPGLRAMAFKPLPKSVKLPDGRAVPVDVLERKYRLSYQVIPEPAGTPFSTTQFPTPKHARRSRNAIIRPGISVSQLVREPGTIGAIVYDNQSGVPYILSNAHVLAGAGASGEEVVQPAKGDDANVGANTLGRLIRSHVGPDGDCAVASIESRLYSGEVIELGVTPRQVAVVELGDSVTKSGRTTGLTRGIVVRVGVFLPHPSLMGSVATEIVESFEIGPDPAHPAAAGISAGGDSGSLWMICANDAPTDIAAGLHYAVNDDSGNAVACYMHRVLKRLDVSLRPRI